MVIYSVLSHYPKKISSAKRYNWKRPNYLSRAIVLPPKVVHPNGETEPSPEKREISALLADTFDGMYHCYSPLLSQSWVLDADVTVKPLYGKQEGAVVGYNPHKPGRPSHTYHTYMIANLRLILDVEVQAGNQSSSAYPAPGLWALLERMPSDLVLCKIEKGSA